MPIPIPARRCLLGLSLGAACTGAVAQPVASLADYSLEQLSDIIVVPAPVAASAGGGHVLQAFPASGYLHQPADSAQCVQPRRLWSEPAARTGRAALVGTPAPRMPERAH